MRGLCGEVAEWPKAPVLKTGEGLYPSKSSNLFFSAIYSKNQLSKDSWFFFARNKGTDLIQLANIQ